MWTRKSSLILAVAAILGACGPGQVTVSAELQVADPEGGGMMPQPIGEKEVQLIPFNRDLIFDSLTQAAPTPEPPIPDSVLQLIDDVQEAQAQWRAEDSRWATLRDSLKVISEATDRLDPASPEYARLFREFDTFFDEVTTLERTKEGLFAEFTGLTKNYAGLTYDNLGATGKLWPCPDPDAGDGVQILFGDRFPTKSGRGKFVPCPWQPPDELPDEAYPFVLSTGRVLEHWHTGSMTRRSKALSAIEPEAFACLHPGDLAGLGVVDGEQIEIASRRGRIRLAVRADTSIDTGTVFVPFHFREAAANILTTDALDPYGKIPEFKFCAVKISAVSE